MPDVWQIIIVTLGDKVVPKELEYSYPSLFEDKKILIYTYNTETIIVEKIETILRRGQYNSRMKDYYDIHMFLSKFKETIDINILKLSIKDTFDKRESFSYLKDYEQIKNIYEMNEYIIQKWNSIVKEDDTVYHLGDVGFGLVQEINRLVERLNGTKILLKGNHDFKIGTNTWKEVGFSEVYKKKIVLGNLLLTHAPTEDVGENQINVFGHIHDKPLDEKFEKKNHICVSCDVIDYTPVSVEEIMENNKLVGGK